MIGYVEAFEGDSCNLELQLMRLCRYPFLEEQNDLNFTVVVTLKDYIEDSFKTDIIYCSHHIKRGILYNHRGKKILLKELENQQT